MRTVIAIVVAGLIGGTVLPAAAAGTRDPGVNVRQHHQKHRLRQGVRSGELTRHEAQNLREERRDIRQLERAYKSDGALTAVERKDLHRELNQLSGEIRAEKHDAQQR